MVQKIAPEYDAKVSGILELLRRPDEWASPDAPFLPWGTGQEQLATYCDLLLKWNKALNLVSCKDARSLLQDLVQDSFQLAMLLATMQHTSEIWDLGAGSGLPGIPLRIFWQTGCYTMVDRSAKRCLFLQNVLAMLTLKRTRIWQGDALEFMKAQRLAADVILSRAFMPWRKIIDLCNNFLSTTGTILIMANQQKSEKLPAGWVLSKQISYALPGKTRWLWALTRSPYVEGEV